MEADSTTFESNAKSSTDICLPFNSKPANFNLYKDFLTDNGERSFESQLVSKLQEFGLIPKSISCPENMPECKVVCRGARVIDRVQWICDGCGRRLPIRTGSFFLKLQCSLVQSLQLILAWCEDADVNSVAQHFDVKPRVAKCIFEKLDDLVINELQKGKLGGENVLVLSEMYPDCLNRLSPDTTDQSHVHRILMIADTKHFYRLHVIRKDLKKHSDINSEQTLKEEVENAIINMTEEDSIKIQGINMPNLDNHMPMQGLFRHCDADMQHFLTTGIWSRPITLCSASRELCSGAGTPYCAATVQRYLDVSLYRFRFSDGFYDHMLRLIANGTYISPTV